MQNPFPGMNPWLENPALWLGVHNSMIVYIRDQLQPLLAPRYVAAVEDRVFVEGPDRRIGPDVWIRRDRAGGSEPGAVAVMELDDALVIETTADEIHESYIQILDLQTGQQVVTVIELVSPRNKFAGPGRDVYEAKQSEVMQSTAHLVEIDLLRAGPHVLAVPEALVRGRRPYDYLVSVNRARRLREQFETYPRGLRDRLPRVAIPLLPEDADVRLDVQAALDQTYSAGAYGRRIDYSRPCEPPLSPEDQTWATALLAGPPQSIPHPGPPA
jgi:hypothetical protein